MESMILSKIVNVVNVVYIVLSINFELYIFSYIAGPSCSNAG